MNLLLPTLELNAYTSVPIEAVTRWFIMDVPRFTVTYSLKDVPPLSYEASLYTGGNYFANVEMVNVTLVRIMGRSRNGA